MGVKGDDILLAGVHEGTESPNKVAKAAKRTFAAGLDLLTLKQRNPPPEQIKNVGAAFRRPYNISAGKAAATLQLFIMNYEFEVCPALGSVSPDRPQSELRRFALFLGDSVPSFTPAKGTLSLLTPVMTASPFFIFFLFSFFFAIYHYSSASSPICTSSCTPSVSFRYISGIS